MKVTNQPSSPLIEGVPNGQFPADPHDSLEGAVNELYESVALIMPPHFYVPRAPIRSYSADLPTKRMQLMYEIFWGL